MIGKVMLVLHMPSAKDLCFIVICQKNDVEDVEFFRTDPATESEHLQLCKDFKPDVVMVRPEDMTTNSQIFMSAMEEGYVHKSLLEGVGPLRFMFDFGYSLRSLQEKSEHTIH